ncbi:DUF397 domain-containing protein [Streptomyces sp. KLOTTS4A1]|uniref:DUF397 domain-containing protein n=1 Tax=Streptomyces sp. KLOTTS4A1 TaxID=3390996 RepID=UPI0039F50AE2
MDHGVAWQKSSYSGSGDGNNCVELAAASDDRIRLREGDDPSVELTTDAAALAQFFAALRGRSHDIGPGVPRIAVVHGDDNLVRLHTTSAPGTVVTTTRHKWEVFVRGVRAGEFDHFLKEGARPQEA